MSRKERKRDIKHVKTLFTVTRRSKMNFVSLFTYEFNRITFIPKNDTRHERLVKGNSFVCNTMIHSIQYKREVTLCCVHHNTNTVSCVNVFSPFFPWPIFFFDVIVRRSRHQREFIAIKVPPTFIPVISFILVYVRWCYPNENVVPIVPF